MDKIQIDLWGDRLKSSLDIETKPSISNRLGITEYQLFSNTTGVTTTQRNNLNIASEEYTVFRTELNSIIDSIGKLEEKIKGTVCPIFERSG